MDCKSFLCQIKFKSFPLLCQICLFSHTCALESTKGWFLDLGFHILSLCIPQYVLSAQPEYLCPLEEPPNSSLFYLHPSNYLCCYWHKRSRTGCLAIARVPAYLPAGYFEWWCSQHRFWRLHSPHTCSQSLEAPEMHRLSTASWRQNRKEFGRHVHIPPMQQWPTSTLIQRVVETYCKVPGPPICC